MIRKIIVSGEEAKKKFLAGVNKVDELVGGTLGPGGRNRVIQRKYKAPLIINDGAAVARHMVLDDPIEDMAAQTVIEVAMQTSYQAGDGTTSSTVMAAELFRTALDREKDSNPLIGGGKENVMQMWREIRDEKDKAIEILKKMAKPLKKKDMEHILTTSLEDQEQGKTLAELLVKLGKDAYVSVEDNWATKYGITTEITSGMKFLGKYASPYLVTTANEKEAVWEETYVLVTNHRFDTIKQIEGLIKEATEKGARKLVIIGGYSEGSTGFSELFIKQVAGAFNFLLQNPSKRAGVTEILAVKAPSLTSDELQDVADFVGAKFYDKNLGLQLDVLKLEDLGYAKKVSVTEDEVNVIGGSGDPSKRIEVLKAQLEEEKDQMFKEKMKRRIASLSAGVGVIRVGAQTESERSYLKYKFEDAMLAAKAAWEEGWVPGGGLSFKKVAEELGEGSILYRTLMSISKRIKENAGEVDIPETIINPLKVDRIALENACSGAGALITADGAIAEKKQDLGDYFQKVMKKALPIDERDDFRDSENQDQGIGRLVD